ncbi:PIN domain-containing protein [Bacteroides timonensis]|uniref:PIN domain-containing protein n=1 Tax=Bacteroides timonensis TaxID=1470345 RepID=UPI0004B41658|nr:PIN domain-containing protein [Bacteroides timonensis]
MKKYLLDTNICVFLFRDKYNVAQKMDEIGVENCYISSVTVAELKYGLEYGGATSKRRNQLDHFLSCINIVTFEASIDVYAREKSRLRKEGLLIDDFDLLIASALWLKVIRW